MGEMENIIREAVNLAFAGIIRESFANDEEMFSLEKSAVEGFIADATTDLREL